jgi:hypothetical protein
MSLKTVIPCAICALLAGCTTPPVDTAGIAGWPVLPYGPHESELPENESGAVYRVELTIDATGDVERVSEPIPLYGKPEPADADFQIDITAAHAFNRLDFTRKLAPHGGTAETWTRLNLRQMKYDTKDGTRWTGQDAHGEQTGTLYDGDYYEEWALEGVDKLSDGTRILHVMLRTRFRSPHPDWDITESTLTVELSPGRIKAFRLFATK